MKKIALIALIVFLVIAVFKIGFLNTFLLCAGALLLVIIISVFIYALFYKKQKDEEIWEDEP